MSERVNELYSGILQDFLFKIEIDSIHRYIYSTVRQSKSKINKMSYIIPQVLQNNLTIKVFDGDIKDICMNTLYVCTCDSTVSNIILHVKLCDLVNVLHQLSILDIKRGVGAVFWDTTGYDIPCNVMKKYKLGLYFDKLLLLDYSNEQIELVFKKLNNIKVKAFDMVNNPIFINNLVNRVSSGRCSGEMMDMVKSAAFS